MVVARSSMGKKARNKVASWRCGGFILNVLGSERTKGKSHVLIGAFSSQILGNLQEFGGFGLREKVVFAKHITR